MQAGSIYENGLFLPLAYGIALLGLATDPRVSDNRWWGAVAALGVLVAGTPLVLLAGSDGNLAASFVVPLALGVGCLLYIAGVVTMTRQTGEDLLVKTSLLPVVALPLDGLLVIVAPFLLGAFALAWMAFGGALALSTARRRARTDSGGW